MAKATKKETEAVNEANDKKKALETAISHITKA